MRGRELPIVGAGWWVKDEMEVGGSRIRGDESLHHGTVTQRERERERDFDERENEKKRVIPSV